jgi:hypothetical protein
MRRLGPSWRELASADLWTLARRLRLSQSAKAVALLSSGALVQNLILVVTMPVLARLFDPAEFGVAGFLYAIVSILVPLSSGQYYNGMLLPRKDVEAINIFALSILLSLVICTVLMVAAISFGAPLAAWTSSPELWSTLLLIVPGLTLVQVVLQACRYWALRKIGYRQLFRNNMLETVSLVCCQLGAGLAGFGALGLIAGADPLAGCVCGLFRIVREEVHGWPVPLGDPMAVHAGALE